jgi:hypothetical protein
MKKRWAIPRLPENKRDRRDMPTDTRISTRSINTLEDFP